MEEVPFEPKLICPCCKSSQTTKTCISSYRRAYDFELEWLSMRLDNASPASQLNFHVCLLAMKLKVWLFGFLIILGVEKLKSQFEKAYYYCLA